MANRKRRRPVRRPAVHRGPERSTYAVVRALLDAGADKDFADTEGITPLYVAAEKALSISPARSCATAHEGGVGPHRRRSRSQPGARARLSPGRIGSGRARRACATAPPPSRSLSAPPSVTERELEVLNARAPGCRSAATCSPRSRARSRRARARRRPASLACSTPRGGPRSRRADARAGTPRSSPNAPARSKLMGACIAATSPQLASRWRRAKPAESAGLSSRSTLSSPARGARATSAAAPLSSTAFARSETPAARAGPRRAPRRRGRARRRPRRRSSGRRAAAAPSSLSSSCAPPSSGQARCASAAAIICAPNEPTRHAEVERAQVRAPRNSADARHAAPSSPARSPSSALGACDAASSRPARARAPRSRRRGWLSPTSPISCRRARATRASRARRRRRRRRARRGSARRAGRAPPTRLPLSASRRTRGPPAATWTVSACQAQTDAGPSIARERELAQAAGAARRARR